MWICKLTEMAEHEAEDEVERYVLRAGLSDEEHCQDV